MRLNRDETITAYNCVATVMRGFSTAAAPWAVQRLYEELNREVRTMSRPGPESGCGGEQLKADQLLSSRQVATMLGCSKRHVNRNAEHLGALNIDGINVFPASAIREHLEGRDA